MKRPEFKCHDAFSSPLPSVNNSPNLNLINIDSFTEFSAAIANKHGRFLFALIYVSAHRLCKMPTNNI